jgi:hypothetical protein
MDTSNDCAQVANKQFGFTEIPEDASKITEDEFERLPDYVQILIDASSQGQLQHTTHEELVSTQQAFFERIVEVVTSECTTEVVKKDCVETPLENTNQDELH